MVYDNVQILHELFSSQEYGALLEQQKKVSQPLGCPGSSLCASALDAIALFV